MERASRFRRTNDGLSGIATNPIQPHTITKAGRTCEDCHASRKAVGLGSGMYESRRNGEEQDRILRVSVCISCHDVQTDPGGWKKIIDVTGLAKTDARHREFLRKIFDSGTIK